MSVSSEIIKQMDCRGWDVYKLSDYSGIGVRILQGVMDSSIPVSGGLSSDLSFAFDMPDKYWMEMDAKCRAQLGNKGATCTT